MFLLWLFTVCCVILVVVFVTLVYKRCFNGLYEPHIHQLQQLFLFILIFGKYQTCCGLFMAATGGVWIIPSFRIWDYVLYVDHISYVITNCGQHLFWIALEALLGVGGAVRFLVVGTIGQEERPPALDGAVFDITQILAYLVHNMSRSQLYLGFGHFGWLPSFFGQ